MIKVTTKIKNKICLYLIQYYANVEIDTGDKQREFYSKVNQLLFCTAPR
jgi:hypothetical protein